MAVFQPFCLVSLKGQKGFHEKLVKRFNEAPVLFQPVQRPCQRGWRMPLGPDMLDAVQILRTAGRKPVDHAETRRRSRKRYMVLRPRASPGRMLVWPSGTPLSIPTDQSFSENLPLCKPKSPCRNRTNNDRGDMGSARLTGLCLAPSTISRIAFGYRSSPVRSPLAFVS